MFYPDKNADPTNYTPIAEADIVGSHQLPTTASEIMMDNGKEMNQVDQNPTGEWNHTSCLELHKDSCCGCLDNGVCYIVKHMCCLPCSFGTMAEKVSDGETGRICCGCGITVGFLIGAFVFGGPMLPCAVRIRRCEVKKYGIRESFVESLARICCCPGASLIQMLMQAEEEEGGEVGLCGCWYKDSNVESMRSEGTQYQRMER